MVFDSPRQMYDVDLTCAKCGGHISQLPFQPSGDRPVYCADCNRAYRQSRPSNGGFGGGSRGPRPPRQMYQVNLTCASCGAPITELPFEPRGDKPVYCPPCLKTQRGR